MHSAWFAGGLSLVCCVVGGQVYNRQYVKAIVLGLLAGVLAVVTGGISLAVTWPVMILDAALIGNKLARGQAVEQWEFF